MTQSNRPIIRPEHAEIIREAVLNHPDRVRRRERLNSFIRKFAYVAVFIFMLSATHLSLKFIENPELLNNLIAKIIG